MAKKRKRSPATINSIAEDIRREHDLSTEQAKELTRTFMSSIERNLLEDRDVILKQVGVISPVFHDERLSSNPATGEQIIISQRYSLKLRPSDVYLKNMDDRNNLTRTYRTVTPEEAEEFKKQKKKK